MKARFHMVSLFQIYSVYGMRFSDLLGGFSSEAGGERILIKLTSYERRKPMEIVVFLFAGDKKNNHGSNRWRAIFMSDERRLTVRDEATNFLLYTAPDGQVKVECVLHDETIWLTQDRIAELFGVQRPAITKHLKNIFESGELEEKVVGSILEHTTQHGAIDGKTQTRAVKFYNLDAIISVGYAAACGTHLNIKTA
jgi:predicted XRE-type DNA-binding protein